MSLAPDIPLPPECLAANAATLARWDRLARDARRDCIWLLMTLHAATGIETARLACHFAQESTLRCRVRARKPDDIASKMKYLLTLLFFLVAGVASAQTNGLSSIAVYSGNGYWSAKPVLNSGWTKSGQADLCAYIWNTAITNMPGDNRSSVGVVTTFGVAADQGSIIEFLPRKSLFAKLNSGVFAHPLRLDGYGRVMVGNIPEGFHTAPVMGGAYLEVWTGGNTDVPALRLAQEGLSAHPVAGALERADGKLWWTDDQGQRWELALKGKSAGKSSLEDRGLRLLLALAGVWVGAGIWRMYRDKGLN